MWHSLNVVVWDQLAVLLITTECLQTAVGTCHICICADKCTRNPGIISIVLPSGECGETYGPQPGNISKWWCSKMFLLVKLNYTCSILVGIDEFLKATIQDWHVHTTTGTTQVHTERIYLILNQNHLRRSGVFFILSWRHYYPHHILLKYIFSILFRNIKACYSTVIYMRSIFTNSFFFHRRGIFQSQ